MNGLRVQGLYGVFERFRGILHEGEIDKRVQYTIESLFAVYRTKFAEYPAVHPDLDLVESEDQFTHDIGLNDELDKVRFSSRVLGVIPWSFC
jgi:pre-mRNA-splicing factor CWC22